MGYQNSILLISEKETHHEFITYELNYPIEKEAFLEYLLPTLKEEYGVGVNLEEKIKNINPDRVRNIKKFMLKNNTPDPNVSAPPSQPWLKNTRNKMAECLAKDLLRKLESVSFTCRLSEEEDPDMPKRGIDNFGFVFKDEGGSIALQRIVACEVKASDSKDSPPLVVHSGKDSMFKSCKEITTIDKRLQKALAKSIDKLTEGEYLELVCSVGSDIDCGDSLDSIKKKLMVVPFLLRKKQHYTPKDFGKFRTHFHEFENSTIKYYIVTIDYDLTAFADEVFTTLREG